MQNIVEEIHTEIGQIMNNICKPPPAPNNAVVIVKSLPYSEKYNYMEIPR